MSRRALLLVARYLFVVVAIAFAWWGFRGRWGEVAAALADVGPWRLLAATATTALGLAVTALLWRLLLRWVGSDAALRDAAGVFLVGQLGKYVPGSVWSVAAHAHLGRRHEVPPQSSVAASSLFLLVHTASGLLLGGLLALAGAMPDMSRGLAAVAVLVGAVALVPALVRRVATRLSGHATRFGARELVSTVVLMILVWTCHGVALLVLLPGSTERPGVAGAVSAFALAHAAGVLVVLAPAGVGAREGVLVALLASSVGVPVAAAAGLLARIVHVVADFAVAGLASWWAARARRSTALEVREPAHAQGR